MSGPIVSTTVAAFDFDGTLTRRDSVTGFLRRAGGTARLGRAVVHRAPLLVGVVLGRVERDRAKDALLTATLSGRHVEHVDQVGARYAVELRDRLRADVLARLRWHQRQGHRTVIVSASLRPYLDPIAAWLGIDHVLCTELQRDATGHLTGHIAGTNCRGPEKVARLQAWLGAAPDRCYAYGDSPGDRELLAWASDPLQVKRVRVAESP